MLRSSRNVPHLRSRQLCAERYTRPSWYLCVKLHLIFPWILTLTAGNSIVFQLVIYALSPILLLGQRFLLIDLGGWPYLLLLFLVVLVTKAHPTRAVASDR